MQNLKNLSQKINIKKGVPCDHPGCRSHVTHPCEVCGRIKCGTEEVISCFNCQGQGCPVCNGYGYLKQGK